MGYRARQLVGRPWLLIALIALVGFFFWVYQTRVQPHEVKVGFAEALNLARGLNVKVDGIEAGKVTTVEQKDGYAIVGLGIEDDKVWPLHQGTRAIVRWGTTVGDGTRYIELRPGPKSGPEIPEGGIIPTDETVTTVEFDDVFNTFDGRTRTSVRNFARNGTRSLRGRESDLSHTLESTPDALFSTSAVLRDLSTDGQALRHFVRDTSKTTGTISQVSPQLRSLVSGLAATMDEFGAHATAVRHNLERFPGTLVEARTTLARLDTSVDRLDPLLTDIRPGARRLRVLAHEARPALRELRRTVPQAVSTIRTVKHQAPDITSLLRRGQPFARDIDPMFRDLSPMIACIRPYAPEITNFFPTWSGFSKNLDPEEGHFARVRGIFSDSYYSNQPERSTQEYVATSGDQYAYPRPPGLGDGTGDPWFIRECGYGPETMQPARDPEDR
jgi:virulence factor Mce-like protein